MKKLNSSWKVAGFALLFGLALQSCDQVIDNPLSPSQPIPATPADPVNPSAAVKDGVITIKDCATTKDVNTLLASNADVKKLFADAEAESIEIVVNGGIKIADAIAIPASAANAPITLTFKDAFTEAKKDLTITNNAANTAKFTVTLPDAEDAIDLNLTGNSGTYIGGKAVIDTLITNSIVEDTWVTMVVKQGVQIAKYDYTKQTNVYLLLNDVNAIKAAILKDSAEVSKEGFRADNAYTNDGAWDGIYTPNAIVEEGNWLAINPRSTQSKAGTITLGKNAELHFNWKQDPENEKLFYYVPVESIVGQDGTATVYAPLADEKNVTVSYNEYEYEKSTIKAPVVGSFSNVILPYAETIPANADSKCTFTRRITIDDETTSVDGYTFKGGVKVMVPAKESGSYTFTFNGSTFGDSDIWASTDTDIAVLGEDGKPIKYTLYEWLDKNGEVHYSTVDPKDEETFASLVGKKDVEATNSIVFKDFTTILSFQNCKRGNDALSNINLAPITYQTTLWNDKTPIKYQIGSDVYKKASWGTEQALVK